MKIWFTQCAVVVASSLIVPLAGIAQSALPAKSGEEKAVIMPTFTIQSEAESGYAATNSISATKVATELKKMPVSIDVLTEQLFKDYGLTEIYDIIGLSSGVSSTQRAATGNLESYTIRGFTTFFSARNGNTNFRSFDSANVSRVEVVNGPASVLYGQLDPGGVANTVTKQPSAKRASNLKLDIGSWEYYRAEIGTTGPFKQLRHAHLPHRRIVSRPRWLPRFRRPAEKLHRPRNPLGAAQGHRAYPRCRVGRHGSHRHLELAPL
jgi:iron complex outermembrane recepter protein